MRHTPTRIAAILTITLLASVAAACGKGDNGGD
jgi:NAD(P)H-hydrate repair Nnr-like enzyme with NAD(P)H-hydrate epimerase domain